MSKRLLALGLAVAISVAGMQPAHAATPKVTAAETQKQAAQFSSLKESETLNLGEGITVTRQSGNLVVHSPAEEDRSVCGTTIATVLFGLGSVVLFGMAAALGPGEVAVIAGVEMTADQLGYAAAASGSFSALEAWADAKFCS